MRCCARGLACPVLCVWRCAWCALQGVGAVKAVCEVCFKGEQAGEASMRLLRCTMAECTGARGIHQRCLDTTKKLKLQDGGAGKKHAPGCDGGRGALAGSGEAEEVGGEEEGEVEEEGEGAENEEAEEEDEGAANEESEEEN